MPARAAGCRNWDPGCGSMGAVQRGRSWVNIPKALNHARTVRQLPLRNQIFFCAKDRPEDRPKGPPTANSHQPPTATNRQPPTATNRRQPPAATNRQPPTTTNGHQPPITNHQPPPAATNHQLPTANCQSPPTANSHQPWLNTWSARGFFRENCVTEHFFFPMKDRPVAMPIIPQNSCPRDPEVLGTLSNCRVLCSKSTPTECQLGLTAIGDDGIVRDPDGKARPTRLATSSSTCVVAQRTKAGVTKSVLRETRRDSTTGLEQR